MDIHRALFLYSILLIYNEHTKMLVLGLNEDQVSNILLKRIEDSVFKHRNYDNKSKIEDESWTLVQKYGDDIIEMEDESWAMVQRKGNQFVLNDQPFYINGFNTYWLMVFAADKSTRGKVTEVFEQASNVGLTLCRTWAFNDGQWCALQKKPSVYDEDVFKALDFVVSEAKRYRIRLTLSLINNWEDYGGKPQYVKWGKEAGLNLTNDDDFFSNPTLKSYYKSHVKTVLNRVNTITNIAYKDDPTIFAWELINEPRCPSDPSGDTLQEWIEEMAVYVKSIDPKHLVEIGLEGFYGPSTPNKVQYNPDDSFQQVGTDFIRNHQVLAVDFASVHMYADSWISERISETHIKFIKSWMQSHIDDAEKYLGIPVIFSEFGVSKKDRGYNTLFQNNLISTVYNILLDSARKGGSGGGSLLWQIFPDGTEYMDDGYAINLSESPSTSDIILQHSTRLALFNSLSKWKSHWGCNKNLDFDGFDNHFEL
uniref:mannan endo-1,4-beta-mannosidase 6-like n=1 Tax=Erigeron canadensis TaxID=72917 RepID=UPI001CB9002D|nr:mannan endo-1,4-beta-mannosidase 6-like [Erigeron canadensis]